MMQTDAPRAPPGRTVVFTDLDGSLMDHADYSLAAALPVLARLRDLGIPLVAATSKTAAEVVAIYEQFDNRHPFIFENGGGIGIPCGYFPRFTRGLGEGRYRLHLNGRPYDEIVGCLHRLRERHGWRFSGFADWSSAEVSARTGLSPDAARAAKQRMVSEPLLWEDNQAALSEFARYLREQNLHLQQGGRFLSVQSEVDKGQAMQQLSQLYADHRGGQVTTIACGDSPNDLGMLVAADLALVIPDRFGRHMDVPRRDGIYYAGAPGPAGWSEGIGRFLF